MEEKLEQIRENYDAFENATTLFPIAKIRSHSFLLLFGLIKKLSSLNMTTSAEMLFNSSMTESSGLSAYFLF